MKKDRNEQLINGFLANGFEFKGIKYKPIGARSLVLLEKCKSPYYYGGDRLRGILDVLYISSHESSDILPRMNNDTWEETIIDYAEGFTTQDLSDIGDLLNKQSEDAAAAIVEIKDTNKKKP